MSPHVEVAVEGAAGVLRLDRPKALNALDTGMLQALDAGITRFQDRAESSGSCWRAAAAARSAPAATCAPCGT